MVEIERNGEIAPTFRCSEGHVAIRSGPTIEAFDTTLTSVLFYPRDAEPRATYRGLAAIKREAESRARRT